MEIYIMDKKAFANYNREGRYGYICRVKKQVTSISPTKCALWFAKNRHRYGTRRFIMVTETRHQAMIIGFKFRMSGCFKGVLIRNIEADEAALFCSEKPVKRTASLAVLSA